MSLPYAFIQLHVVCTLWWLFILFISLGQQVIGSVSFQIKEEHNAWHSLMFWLTALISKSWDENRALWLLRQPQLRLKGLNVLIDFPPEEERLPCCGLFSVLLTLFSPGPLIFNDRNYSIISKTDIKIWKTYFHLI